MEFRADDISHKPQHVDVNFTKKTYKLMDVGELKLSLFAKIRLGQANDIPRILCDVAVNCTNEKDETPLISASVFRNYDIQKLLISKGAEINERDRAGRTALHYGCENGDVQSIYLLLAHDADLNTKDVNGKTPLHLAVSGGHLAAVDILLFCGADSTIKDNYHVTPKTRNPAIRGLLVDSTRTLQGIKYGCIKIDRCVLKSEDIKYLPNLDITITTPSTFSSTDVYMLSRRSRSEFIYTALEKKELLMSDAFEFKVSGAGVLSFANIELPLFSNAEYYEEVYMKTNVVSVQSEDNKEVFDIKLSGNELSPVTCVNVDFRVVDFLYMVSRPILERFQLSEKHGTTFNSQVSDGVTLYVENETFNSGGCLLLQILREPIVEKDQEDFQQLVSSTNFHQVKHSNFEQPLKITELTLPVPNDYSFSSNVLTYVLLRPGEHGDNHNPSIWNIIDRNPKKRKHKIYVPLDHFGHVQCVQYQFQTTDSVIKEETEQRYQSALRAKSQARFLALVKSLNKENKAEVIIECTSDLNFKRRIEYWESRGYTDQNPSHSLPFQVCSAQTFTLDITGGLRKKTSAEIQLEFHPKRKKNNIREILIEPSVKDDKNIEFHGKLEILRLTEDKKRSKLQGTKGPRNLELLDFIKLHTNPHEIDLAKTINFAGFTCDSLMIDIHDRLNAEERRKVLVHLRIDFNKNMTDGDIKQSFLEWGHMVIKHRDLGVTNLILSLTEVNEKQAIRVLKDLKKWKADNKKIRTAFTAWLDDLKPDNNIDVKKVRRPLSDDYFKALAHILVTNDNKITPHDLFTRLSLPDAAVENVTKNHLFRKPIIQFYTLLKKYRSGWNSEIQCLKKLQAVLSSDKLKIEGAADWADRMAKNWINSESVNKSDEFYQKLKEYLSPGSNESSDSDN